jgi:ubiquinone/menaquinone biosynthesis C-methylase UbiE
MVIWIILALAFLVLIIAMLGYPRMTFPRQPSLEGVEDPEAVQAYDRISRWPQFKVLRRRVVVELKKHHPKGSIVDVGCGPGYLVADIAEALPHLHVIGVDIAEEMIEVAARNLSSLGLSEQVEFRRGDAQNLPFEDNAVDFVVSTLSLHHWSDPRQALQEIYRVLKPEGQFLLFDLRRNGRRLFYWLLRFAQTFVVPAALRRINEPIGSVLSSYTPAELEALLSGTPFQQWRIKPGLGWMFVWGSKG